MLRVDAGICDRFARQLLVAWGCEADEAAVLSENLVWNSCIGRETQGLWRLPYLLERLRRGRIASPCQPVYTQKGPALGLLAGGNGFGQVLGEMAMGKACELARSQGLGAVGVRNSNWNGSGAYYVHLAAEQGLIGLCTSNSVPKVAPYGGTLPVFGTNPIAFGVPRADGRTILIDLATAEQAGSMTIQAQRQGLPAGPGETATAILGQAGTQPFGGAKGYGLGLLAEILSGVLTGAAVSHDVASLHQDFSRDGGNGQFFLALDIARLMPLASFYARLEQLIDLIHAAGGETLPAPRLPGEARWQAFAQARREGLSLDADTAAALTRWADEKGLAPPW